MWMSVYHLGSSIEDEELTYKEISRRLRLIEQWAQGLLSWTSHMVESQQPKTTSIKGEILCGHYCPNYFALPSNP